MRRYEIVLSDDKVVYFDAEMDSLNQGCLILSKKKENKGAVLRADEKPEIVRVFSLYGIQHYGYVELNA